MTDLGLSLSKQSVCRGLKFSFKDSKGLIVNSWQE